MKGENRVYLFQDDDGARVVEAPSFEAAMAIWRKWYAAAAEMAENEAHPNQVTEVSDEPVLRDHVCTLPDSISEALNSGDGSYRP